MHVIRFLAVLALAPLAIGQQPSNPIIGTASTLKPKLPVIDEYACPGKGNTVRNVKIDTDDRIYPSWKGKEKSVGTLKAGDEVTVLGGANVIREPGTAIIKYVGPDDSPSLKVGDVALVYGLDADENIVFWAKGVWFGVWIEAVAEKGQCGFTSGFGGAGCTIDIIRNGVSEWWVQVRTSTGLTGWVLAQKFNDQENWQGNFGDLCHYGED
ncbi:MAG TPA: hypothetical protein VFA85_13680 [Terriglobales bacterium]|nr:hypothetical protein [Terriglobales bacterium]